MDKISSLDLFATCSSEHGATTEAGHLEPPQPWMAEEEAFIGKVESIFFAWLPIIWERGKPLLETLVVWVAMDG